MLTTSTYLSCVRRIKSGGCFVSGQRAASTSTRRKASAFYHEVDLKINRCTPMYAATYRIGSKVPGRRAFPSQGRIVSMRNRRIFPIGSSRSRSYPRSIGTKPFRGVNIIVRDLTTTSYIYIRIRRYSIFVIPLQIVLTVETKISLR